MNSPIALSLLVALCMSSLALVAQENRSATNAPPRRPRPTPLVSPEFLPDGGVTFRFRAPKATEVKIEGQFGTHVAKETQGTWSVTVPSVPAGVHEYHWVVDGLSVIDPQNPAIKPQRWPGSSILHVPAKPSAPWDLQDIPHGTVHEHVYKSKALGTWRRIVVYTPPGAEKLGRLPVLYLSHGYSDNEATWTVHGKAHWILDSLIAQKKAVPMIVVMPDGHALAPRAGRFEDYGPGNSAALCRELSEDIIPLVEGTYKVNGKARARAFAGLSMGGHHALTVALKHHEQFNWIGAFSAAPPPTNSIEAALGHAESVNRDLKLFWIACGKKDFLFKGNGDFTALLKSKGVRHEYVETEGDHTWPVWRRYLAEFTPKLFR